MMIKDINMFLKEIVHHIGISVPIKQVILFGSYAKGIQDRDSDLDLLIVAPFTDRPVKRRMMIRKLLKDFDSQIGIDILAYTPEEISLLQNEPSSFLNGIIKEGRVIYDAAAV
jgi:predicted nucleotidyltransferase